MENTYILKGRSKTLFTDNMVIYVENSMASTKDATRTDKWVKQGYRR